MSGNKTSDRKLPKGISYIKSRDIFMGRFKHCGVPYTFYDRDIKKLEKRLNDARYEAAHGLNVKKRTYSIDEWYELWIQYKKAHVKKGTILDYEETYRAYIKKPLGNKKVADVNHLYIQKLYDKMAEKYAKETIKLVRAVINGMLNHAVLERIIIENPVRLTYIPKVRGTAKKQVPSPEEQKLFMQYAKGNICENIMKVAMGTGMRIGEIRGLEWSNVDFKKNMIYVKATLKNSKGEGYWLDTPKSKSSVRAVFMLPSIAEILQNEKKLQKQKKVMAGDYWEPDKGLENLVFTTDTGRPFSLTRVNCEIKKIEKAMKEDGIKIPHITPHIFRHIFATRGLENGLDTKVMQEILGHNSIDMTLDIYSHVSPQLQKQEMQKVANII